MSHIKLYLFNFLILIMTVPWFFNKTTLQSIFGFPYWAFYSLFLTFIYAVSVFYFLLKYWPTSSSE